MLRYFRRAFKITNENIILTAPLVLFLLLLNTYLIAAQLAPANIFSAILLLITILFMVSAFSGGWFFMTKRSIDLDKQEFIIDEDKSKASFNLIKEFPVGVGEYFLPFVGAIILYSILFALMFFIGYSIGMHFFGNIGLSLLDLKMALASPAAMKSLVSSLSTEQLTKLKAWNILFMIFMMAFSFITMFWSAQIVMKTKNPLIAFFKSISFTFKNLLSAIILFIYINVLSFFISQLTNAIIAFPIKIKLISLILSVSATILYFYFVVYIVVLVFLYYDRENNKQLKIEDRSPNDKLCDCKSCECADDSSDNSADDSSADNSDNGADSDGKDESGDSDSKGD